jgi:prophage tail gpP-like protein
MAKPVQGGRYVIVPGDTLSGIAYQAYGVGYRWRDIWAANQTSLRSGDPNLIYPGETITIPVVTDLAPEPESDSEILDNTRSDEFVILVKGRRLPSQTARAMRSMETVAAGWSAKIYRDPDDSKLNEILRPFAYHEAKIYVGGHLVITGPMYMSEPVVQSDKISNIIEGASYTADIVDSTLDPPYTRRKVTLNQIAGELVRSKGIKVVDNTPALGTFQKVVARPTEKIYEHLVKLAKQKGALIANTPRGELLITKTVGSKSVGSIGDDLARGNDYRAKFDGRKLYNAYRVLSKRRGRKLRRAVAKDDNVPRARTLTIKADDVDEGGVQKAADWERSKRLATALTIPFPVSDWFAPDGTLWRENKIVTVVSKVLFVPDGFDFLIKSVEYVHGPDGRKTILGLVPPQVYTGEPLELPWSAT